MDFYKMHNPDAEAFPGNFAIAFSPFFFVLYIDYLREKLL